jgi:hypothetical protein
MGGNHLWVRIMSWAQVESLAARFKAVAKLHPGVAAPRADRHLRRDERRRGDVTVSWSDTLVAADGQPDGEPGAHARGALPRDGSGRRGAHLPAPHGRPLPRQAVHGEPHGRTWHGGHHENHLTLSSLRARDGTGRPVARRPVWTSRRWRPGSRRRR